MATPRDVLRIALALPETLATSDDARLAVSVGGGKKPKGFVWSWMERVHPKKPRVVNPEVVAIRVGGELDKASLLAADPSKFFTEPHYNGFPAVLVRLAAVDVAELEALLAAAWRCMAPRAVVEAYDARPKGRRKKPAKAATPSPRRSTRKPSRR
jgi:hypothetical protein